jgi:ribose transport system ATP-binding protein
VAEGEIHALVGENGAGKSTLIKILAGVYKADAGDIRFKGRDGVSDVRKFPISFVHQDLGLVGTMTVAENIALVSGYAERSGLIAWRSVADEARRIMDLMGVAMDVERPVSSLAIAERSLVAIARGLAVDARLLILDEPTAALPAADVHRLFQVVRRLRDDGISVVHVTHRLDEVFEIGDRVTVLRDGRKAGTVGVAETTPADLVAMIVGRRLSDVFPSSPRLAGTPVLNLKDVETNQAGPVSLTLNSGEILGFVGLRGAGHDSVGRAIFGDVPLLAGQVVLRDTDVGKPHPLEMMRRGVGFVSSKRGEEALAETLSAQENLFPRPAMRRAADSAFMNPRAEAREANVVMRKYGVRPPDPNLAASMFSGGNQQKIVLARWMELGSEVLILEEPTIGVDIGAKAEIYNLLVARLAAGGAVIVVSSDFEEVAGICHRALVFDRGRIVAELPREELSQSAITRLASTSATVQ